MPRTQNDPATHVQDRANDEVLAPEPVRSPRKAALASFLGSTLEYYDFFIYGTAAALVFNKLFFPDADPAVALLGSMATFGVGYLARPLGGIVMSHVGDRVGRKQALMITLLIMGVASLGIGLLPTYEQLGWWATGLLILGRLAQGFSAGAEAAGASTLTVEHSPEGKRGFYTSFVMTGYASGMVLSTLVFIPIAALPEDQLMSWGWRIPFLLSVVVLAVAYWVRTHLDETPVFEEEIKAGNSGAKQKAPALIVLRTQWRDVLRIVFITMYAVMQTIFTVYALAYATGPQVGIDRTTMLVISAVTVGLSIFTIPLAGHLSDRFGRKPVLLIGMLGCSVTIFGYFWAIGEQNIVLIFVFGLLNMSVFYSAWNGVWTVFFPEMFAAPVRYSGMAIGNQFGLVLTGFAPAVATLLTGPGEYGWLPVAIFAVSCALVSAIFVMTARETAFTPIEELGTGSWARAN
ncbi:MFS transporter [Paeniglutamicibacter psychrophenolicus]|uniref:MFS transporter n=1 Tax=Paeniglutamicibacter psychrophenolicus TaxID=257454 RepID=UPI002784920C|nr:MFS transporter [Paeniglutamicibacter psychrophenolicus]MDQ0093140.1 MFS family permease [Paeniglutamicibacter psychrophenolicus]